jgi:hypothetical protein
VPGRHHRTPVRAETRPSLTLPVHSCDAGLQAAEHRPHVDWARGGTGHRLGWFQAKRAMRTLSVVVVDLFGQHDSKVRLIRDDQMIQALPQERADHSTRDGIRPRRADRREPRLDPQPLGRGTKSPP